MRRVALALPMIIWSIAVAPQGYATTVRHLHEWQYSKAGENGPDNVLWYIHEIWDGEGTGFVLSCDAQHKTYMDVYYSMLDDKWLRIFKRKRIEPKMEIKSQIGRITVFGELKTEDRIAPELFFQILQGESNDVAKILLSKDAEIVFPNNSFRIWNIKKADEITKFLSVCGY
jgi:hypothetical protein